MGTTSAQSLQLAREYIVTTAKYQGSSQYDFSFLTSACSDLGNYIPANIQSEDENADAWSACPRICFFGIVRDDDRQHWYYLEDGSYDSNNPVPFFNWAPGQPQQRGEACVAFFNGAKWHDASCNRHPRHVLCMKEIEATFQCPFQVLSINHINFDDGKFFNFDKNTIDAILGNDDWQFKNFNIYNQRTHAVSKCKLWRRRSGGSHSAHGRKNDGTQSTVDWQIGDTLAFSDFDVACNGKKYHNPSRVAFECGFQVLSIDHVDGSGKYFNYKRGTIDSILGRSDWDNSVFRMYNHATDSTQKCRLFRSQNGGSHSGHGRKEPYRTISAQDWHIGDVLSFSDPNVPEVRCRGERFRNPVCLFSDIVKAQSSSPCTRTDISVYPNAKSNELNWVSIFVGLGGLPNPQAGVISIAVGALLEVLNVNDDLNVHFQEAINAEFDQLEDCMESKIEINDAKNDEDDLIAYMQRYEELETVYIADFADEFDELIDDVRLWISHTFKPNDPDNSLLHYASYLPLFRGTINFYSATIQSYLAYSNLKCTEGGEGASISCGRLVEKKKHGLKTANDLVSWINKAYNAIMETYVLQTNDNTGCHQNTHGIKYKGGRPKYYYPLKQVWTRGSSDTCTIQGEVIDNKDTSDDWMKTDLKFVTPQSSTTCSAGNIFCDTYLGDYMLNAKREYASASCCNALYERAAMEIDAMTLQINDWSTDFNFKYLEPANTLAHDLNTNPQPQSAKAVDELTLSLIDPHNEEHEYVLYGLYYIGVLVVLNIVCMCIYCLRKKKANSHLYKRVPSI